MEAKIAAGADDIAYIDLNTNFINWMNETNETILAQRQRLGFDDTAVDKKVLDYYYLADRTSGIDTIHINDHGTDNAAYIVMREAKSIVDKGVSADATESEKTQSAVLYDLVKDMSSDLPNTVSDEIVKSGWPINDHYPYPSSESVTYQVPDNGQERNG